MPKAAPFTSETARELGRKGGLARAENERKRALRRADERLRDKLEREADRLADVLLDAAYARNGFETLNPKERLSAVKSAIDYGIGRPRQVDPRGDGQADEEPEDEGGISFVTDSEADTGDES